MKLISWIITVLYIVASIKSEDQCTTTGKPEWKYPTGDPRWCVGPSYIFEVLPGFGWDNLVNENRGLVVNFNYSRCKTTEDKRYLIPDGIVTLPIKTSRMNVFSKIYDHWKDYKTDTAVTVNLAASQTTEGGSISGSFSSEFQNVKSHQIEDHAITTKVQVRHVRYRAQVLPDIQLDNNFRGRVLKIAHHIQSNRMLSAQYASQLLVRDFGTHVLTSVDAGASIVKVDHVKSSIFENTDIDKFSLSLAASQSIPLLSSKNASLGVSVSTETMKKYRNSLTNSDIRTYGGPALNSENFTVEKWTSDIGNDLVPVDRDGYPLDYFVTTTTFPELSSSLIQEVVQTVKASISVYYKHNTYPGCTKMDSPNFSHIANIDDGTCDGPINDLSFGGIFQKCQFSGNFPKNLCNELETKNPKTQDTSCPEGYDAALIQKGETTKVQHEHKCHKCWLFLSCCNDYTYTGTATYQSYWCYAKQESSLPKNSGFLFGGLFSDQTSNFVTQSQSCPQYYNSNRITSNIYVCISDDFELGMKSSVPFGGFYSCDNGNPLVKGLKKSCPRGFSNHLASEDNSCEVMYCVKTGSLSELKFPMIKMPPFIGVPAQSLASNTTYIISHDGITWMQVIDIVSDGHPPKGKNWTSLESASDAMQTLREKLKVNYVVDVDQSALSTGVETGLPVGATTLVCAVLGLSSCVIIHLYL